MNAVIQEAIDRWLAARRGRRTAAEVLASADALRAEIRQRRGGPTSDSTEIIRAMRGPIWPRRAESSSTLQSP